MTKRNKIETMHTSIRAVGILWLAVGVFQLVVSLFASAGELFPVGLINAGLGAYFVKTSKDILSYYKQDAEKAENSTNQLFWVCAVLFVATIVFVFFEPALVLTGILLIVLLYQVQKGREYFKHKKE